MNKHYGWIAVGLLSAFSVFGDVILFKSGDKLTGTVKKVSGGKMAFESKVAGKLSLKMDDIQTFSTDESITIEKPDGTRVETKTVAAKAGTITLAASNTALPLTDIAEVNPEAPKWTGSLVAGANFARGNTHSDTASINANAQLRRKDDRISLGAGYRFDKKRDQSTGTDDTTEDKWFINGKYDYFLSDQFYLYGNILYEKDRINNLDMRVTPGAGAGYQWVESDDLNFNTEAGLSYVHAEYSDPSETRDYMAIRLAYHLDKQLWENVKAFHNVTFLPSTERSDIFLVYADAGLQTKLVGSWIMEAKAEMEHNSKPAAGLDKSDYRYILGLGYSF